MRVVVSLAERGDLEAMVVLLRCLFDQEADFTADAELQRRALIRILDAPEVGRILVARAAGRCIGMVSLLYSVSTAEGGIAAWLEDMVVEPDLRGGGVGSLLIEAAVRDCQARGIHRITLLTDQTNTRAQQFYLRHGFTPSAMVPLRWRC